MNKGAEFVWHLFAVYSVRFAVVMKHSRRTWHLSMITSDVMLATAKKNLSKGPQMTVDST